MSDRGRSPGPGGPSGPGSRAGSPSRSDAPGSSLQEKWPQGPGYDPARGAKTQEKGNTRMELPPDAYVSETKKDLFTLRGNKFNTEGKPDKVEVNQYRMTKFDFTKKIYQYDVTLNPEPLKLGPVMKKILAHQTCKQALQRYRGDKWLFDGRKLAWAPVLVDRGQINFRVDLDADRRPGNAEARKGAIFDVTIRNTTEINVGALRGYLEHKTSFNTAVQEALNFLDHLIRQWPSQHMLPIKRNFYRKSEAGVPLGDGGIVEVHKGSYVSVRMSHNFAQGGVGLGYNIDVANTCFWVGRQSMDQMMVRFLNTCDPSRWSNMDPIRIQKELLPVEGKSGLQSSDAFKQLRKLRKLKFTVRHTNRRNDDSVFTIVDFHFDPLCGKEGASARNVKFDYNGKDITIFEYYRQKYKVTLRHSYLPLINAGKKGLIPMELAFVEPMQRYPFKLNPDQTAAMIKIAVTRPNIRKQDIQKNVNDLQIGTDPFLREYGVSFQTQFASTDARILAPPVVKFGQGTADPKFAGRWDLRGKKFWKPNEAPLASWGFVVLERDVPLPALQQFATTFKSTFIGHGGKCTSDAQLLNPPGGMKTNAADSIAWAFEKLLGTSGYPQLIFCVVSRKNSGTYERLKKSADCRFGVLTQVVLGSHVMKNNGQYHSNVCMKVNAKLGGATACTPQIWKSPTYFPPNRPTMLVGVDVSHAAPGGNTPSTAAMTMSTDPDGTKYAAMVETNGYRVEMLTPGNIQKMMGALGLHWRNGHGNATPQHLIYFRDGVGEGQFAQVLDLEIGGIKKFFAQATPGKCPKFTVIIATKRHHIRFFPQKGDRNGNPLPGTLVEKEVTHPFMFDFYLCSHVAIQGTARPVHYHVILDEMNMPVNELQKMIYQQCYSYARSTTPVSLHPAVYYAHLASNRARAHENLPTSDGFRAGPKGHEMIRDKVAKGLSVGGPGRMDEAPPLLELGGRIPDVKVAKNGEIRQRQFFKKTMWFI